MMKSQNMEYEIPVEKLEDYLAFIRSYNDTAIGEAKDHFNSISESYDDHTRATFPCYDDIIENLIITKIKSDSIVLDVCSGTGNIAIPAAQKANEVIGLELTEEMIKVAKNKTQKLGIKNLQFYQANLAFPIDQETDKFDIITAGFMFPIHFCDQGDLNIKVFTELRRVLKPGGLVVIFTASSLAVNYYYSSDEYEVFLSDIGYQHIEFLNINDIYSVVYAYK